MRPECARSRRVKSCPAISRAKIFSGICATPHRATGTTSARPRWDVIRWRSSTAASMSIGIEHLRVADGSVMPRVTAGNTMAPCVVIGERAAEEMKAQHRLAEDTV